jgi:hypothetical protein
LERGLAGGFVLDALPDLAIWDDGFNKRNQIHCHYVMGLGYLSLGEPVNEKFFEIPY